MIRLARLTGWSERFILWELPLERALAYRHAFYWQEGVWTVEPGKDAGRRAEEQLARLEMTWPAREEAEDGIW